MKAAFMLHDEVQFARFLAYAAEHELDVSQCMFPRFIRADFCYFISWSERKCCCVPVNTAKSAGYYIADEVRIQLDNGGDYELFVTICYEHIRD